jgi:NADPH-dependent 7-cyano-7-deazaguanine reductase QueF-like protein
MNLNYKPPLLSCGKGKEYNQNYPPTILEPLPRHLTTSNQEGNCIFEAYDLACCGVLLTPALTLVNGAFANAPPLKDI